MPMTIDANDDVDDDAEARTAVTLVMLWPGQKRGENDCPQTIKVDITKVRVPARVDEERQALCADARHRVRLRFGMK
jgi:hypothetical protein